MFSKTKTFIVLGVIITISNAVLLSYALTNKNPAPSTAKGLKEVVQKQADIKNAELKTVSKSEKGEFLGSGQYKYQTLAKSRITTGDPAQLIVANESQSGGHFVLALLGANSQIPADKVNAGWSIHSIANDRMWAPGACSSKPSFLVQGKYIFIDDGKTNAYDRYSSYIVFNMTNGKYNYFGGNNFTKDQGNKEIILSNVNENDKLVFYIDPVDSQGPYAGNTQGKHSTGSDRGYIIRREIDPETMKYTDYSLPFNVPPGIKVYTITNSYNGGLVTLQPKSSMTFYDGKVSDNRIEFSEIPFTDNTVYETPPLDSPLELQLNSLLVTELSNLSQQKPYKDAPNYKAKFSVQELGSNESIKFLIVTQRFGDSSTPTIYNQKQGSVNAMTDSQILKYNYVSLGVF
jgi:hypothetical protein